MAVQLPWFTTKGQIIQVLLAVLACIFSGIKAWPDMQRTNLFTAGAILFYLLVALVAFMILMLVRARALPAEQHRNNEKEDSKTLRPEVLGERPVGLTEGDAQRTSRQSHPRITGAFFKVEIVRYGVIKETRTHGQNWMFCSFKLSLTLSVRGAPSVEIKDIRLRTYRNKPPCRSFPQMTSPQITMLEEQHTGPTFEAYPQIEFHYDGGSELPEFLDLIVIDEFDREHIIHLRDGERYPTLPV